MSIKQSPYTASSQALQQQHANTPAAALQRHKLYLDTRMAQLAKWVRMGVRPEALIRFQLMDMSRSEKLRACSPESIYLGLLACAVSGLEPGALKGEAYLVPFSNKGTMEATFIAGYRGLVKQARRSRIVKGFAANVVFERDVFDLDLGTSNSLTHKPALRERGDIIGAYAIATLDTGHHEIEWMDRDDLEAVKKASGVRSPAWQDWQDQMFRKAPIRRLCKRLPLGDDYITTLALEQATDDGRDQREVLDAVGENTVPSEAPAPSVELSDEEKAAIIAAEQEATRGSV